MNFDFDNLEPICISVRYKGVEYILKEASEGSACKYRNATLNAYRTDEQGKVIGYAGLADAEPLLVSECLFTTDDKRVPLETIRTWPARIVSPLFEKAKEISNLDERGSDEDIQKRITRLQSLLEERAKNVQNGSLNSTAGTSVYVKS
jgi:hypothetical protein